ncbi:MAG: 5-formyltetrahydrofolate cyclo-ligase [Candidatus Omnitrophica bacterium]|nr:5-formyltetrahydrofolate cyclo-ligase [Candidatus Omnitrophota bacterium]
MKDNGKNEIKQQKAEVRKQITGRLRDQDPSVREEKSRIIQQKLLTTEEFALSKTVMTYVSLPSEVSTDYFIEEALKLGKRVAVPYIGPNKEKLIASQLVAIESLEDGPFGIRQPKDGPARKISLKEIELVVVPAIAYDRTNMRLGRGKGFYDRFLSSGDLRSAKKIGLAFSFQIVDSLPSDDHDLAIDRVITDQSS